jgi:hypothetical protein
VVGYAQLYADMSKEELISTRRRMIDQIRPNMEYHEAKRHTHKLDLVDAELERRGVPSSEYEELDEDIG